MARCTNCGMEHDSTKQCVFASFKTKVGKIDTFACCPRCAGQEKSRAAPKPAAKMARAPLKKIAGKPAVKKAARKKPAGKNR